MNIPRFVIAGTSSGVGKTTISTGLTYALHRRGLNVQPFKCGPDYIDPGYLTRAAGLPCHNLDSWMLPEANLKELFAYFNRETDIAVVEGVMGLYDGHRKSGGGGSTAKIANIIEAPVLLILNIAKMSESAAAMALGYSTYDPGVHVSGVILNQVGSPSHLRSAKSAIEERTGLPVVGYLPKAPNLVLPERHLGLVPVAERDNESNFLDELGDLIEEHIDLDLLIGLARQAPDFALMSEPFLFPATPQLRRCRIAVARDAAFNFYYEANIELLKAWGADIAEFSPIADAGLPIGTDGVYIGGGFPEVFLSELEKNLSMKHSLRDAVAAGMPVYAECGGLMYLSGGIADFKGNRYDMVGLLPGCCEMQSKLQRLGYTIASVVKNSPLAEKGQEVRGHLFHWSRLDAPDVKSAAYRIIEPETQAEGFCLGPNNNLLASYLHLHFGSDSRLAKRFVESCVRGSQTASASS
ncbi:hydrogenobyrinic acid a,c-diamide synthase (glutamine-hydrolysing)/cobyrinate a,c-diamide synthase [Dehalogenimonas alkenigignens]|uniref:Cobyrinate a,c-diamide synthase n=1 Tax=Dehalogenimonas alkenigignens TaxID=1217799 RepID=A0A0W0GJ38_9CHLR|nr:cobyrinate a,c-diamide synthase [Dehalogenimonas alkenigignens]KTB48536.1 hydrogenobyrinic acid a,c-diamide synthase (glutamine-hydrolysing)/cobyrinate a,c-diamide synthase [Dehalogenimonas alkenigignens]